MHVQCSAGHLPDLRPSQVRDECEANGHEHPRNKMARHGFCAAPWVQALVLHCTSALNLAAPVRGMRVRHDLWEGAPCAPYAHDPSFHMCRRCRRTYMTLKPEVLHAAPAPRAWLRP